MRSQDYKTYGLRMDRLGLKLVIIFVIGGHFQLARTYYNKTSFLVQIKFITEDSKWFIYKY